MKKMKKALAFVMAMAMVLGMSLTTFAATPVSTDSDFVTIEGVTKADGTPDTAATYTYYQVIDAKYGVGDKNFTGYVWATGMPGAGTIVDNPEEAVKDLNLATVVSDYNLTGTPFNPATDKLTVGTYVVIITPGSGDKIYNPVLVSVAYQTTGSGQNNTASGGTVDVDGQWEGNLTAVGSNVYAKSSPVDLDKKITDTNKGIDAVGQEVEFEISGTMPSYGKEYTSATYKITDTIQNGLEYVGDVKVLVGGTDITSTVGTNYTTTWNTANKTFDVDFETAYILSLAAADTGARKVQIQYSAKITDEAITQVGKNEAKLTYSNTPTTTSDGKTDTEHVYTVGLSGIVNKVDGNSTPLDGATFTLYDSEGKAVKTYVTGDDKTSGSIVFNGLDYNETYTMKETAAPTGYSVIDTVYTITFSDWNADNPDAPTYKVKVTSDTIEGGFVESTVNYGQNITAALTGIINTKLSSLPSTGGIGTTIFTIGGCAIMIVAAGLFFANRRKSVK